MEGVYTKQGVYFIYTLHFSLVHSHTVSGVLYVLYMLSVFFDLRCESVTYVCTHTYVYLHSYVRTYVRTYTANLYIIIELLVIELL